MLYGNTAQDTRQLFFSSWHKYQKKQPLSPLEQQIAEVILAHPEYHTLLDSEHQEQAYFPELGQTNPFLHMGLHLALRDQISLDKPEGIANIYTKLLHRYNDSLQVEHLMIEPLAECLWQSQRDQQMPNEQHYLHALARLLD